MIPRPQTDVIHIYSAKNQKATRYYDGNGSKPMTFTNKPKRLLWVGCCNRKRRAENCIVQCYYDYTAYWCAPGCGCKSAREIKAKRNKEFRNRSRAAKLGWEKRMFNAATPSD